MTLAKVAQAIQWTKEKISGLATTDVRQLRDNAERLSEPDIVARCDEVLVGRPKGDAARSSKPKSNKRLVSRNRAFEMRGVHLQSPIWSRGGVRKSDGVVVVTVWAGDIKTNGGGCNYLLWSPNVEGSCPWSDSPGGRERLEHCKAALSRGEIEGLLVHGQRIEGTLPDDRAASIEGVDPEVVLRMQVEMRGKEYWATWGKLSISN
jgi:hypothetical protein